MRKRLLILIPAFLCASAALAEEALPPLNSPRRIFWAMKCAGPMPALLIASLAAICVLTVIAVIYYRKAGGRNGR